MTNLSLDRIQAAIHAAIDSPIMSEGTQVIRRSGWYQVYNPTLKESSENEVMLSHVNESDVDRRVGETLALYKKFDLPFKWSIGPMSSPGRLEREVGKLASTSWDFRGMTIASNTQILTPDDITVERVDRGNLDDFLSVHLSGWDLHQVSHQVRKKLEMMINHPKCRGYITRKGGQAIAVAGTILKEGFGYLVGAVVLKEHQGSGAYRALVQGRLSDLSESGFSFAVSQARETTSAPILEKLGFETAYRAKIYRFD